MKAWWLFSALTASVTATDQLTKYIVLFHSSSPSDGRYVQLQAIITTPMLAHLTTPEVAMAILAVVLISLITYSALGKRIIESKSENKSFLFKAGMAVIIGGGISNLIDQSTHGGVIDIITVNTLHTNLADIAIFTGAATLILESLTPKKANITGTLK